MLKVVANVAGTAVGTISVDLVRAAMRQEERPAWATPERVAEAARRYGMFLRLAATHPDLAVAPTRDIDYMWHLHMLHPRAYVSDCYRLFGDIMDHDGGFGAEPEEIPELERVFEETAALWRVMYGEAYLGERGDQMVKCTRNCVSRCKRACKTRA